MKGVSLILLLASITLSKSLSATTIANQKAGTGAHLPVGKDGEGEYTAATKGCFDVIDVATPLVLNEIARQPIRTNGSPAIHIADFGTADAGTSLGLLSKMVTAYREKLGERDVVIHYEDQLTNEWQVSQEIIVILSFLLCKYGTQRSHYYCNNNPLERFQSCIGYQNRH